MQNLSYIIILISIILIISLRLIRWLVPIIGKKNIHSKFNDEVFRNKFYNICSRTCIYILSAAMIVLLITVIKSD